MSTIWIVIQNPVALAVSQGLQQSKSSSFESSIMNRDKCNNNRILRNCGSRKTHKSGCQINTTQFTNVATGQRSFLQQNSFHPFPAKSQYQNCLKGSSQNYRPYPTIPSLSELYLKTIGQCSKCLLINLFTDLCSTSLYIASNGCVPETHTECDKKQSELLRRGVHDAKLPI